MQLESEDEIIEKIKMEVSSDNLENLYLIGGSLRLLGRCFMDYNKSIIKNLHNQVIEPNLFLEFLDQLENLQKFQRFFAQYKVNKYAIIVSKALIKYFKPKNLVISTFGLKEGVRFNILSKEEQRKDIVFERCIDFTKTFANEISVESYKNLFLSLGFDVNEKQIKLFSIALILSQYTRHIDKNHKADWIVSFILTTDIPFDQKQRAALIVAIANSLSSKANIIPKSLRKLLSREEYSFSRIIGSLLKIAVIIDGPLLSKPSFGIKTKGNFLEISTQHVLPKIVFDKVCEQLKNISFMKKQLNSAR